jgi:hypothetical protein
MQVAIVIQLLLFILKEMKLYNISQVEPNEVSGIGESRIVIGFDDDQSYNKRCSLNAKTCSISFFRNM